METVILGGGISGLTAAYALERAGGEAVSLFEQAPSVGGLCRITRREGFTFEIVSHVLHFRSEPARQLVHEILDGNLRQIEREAWIYFRQKYVPYPFQTHMGFLPLAEKVSCLMGYWRAWIGRQINGKRPAENFEQWIHQHFGSGIAQHFMVPYNTAVWGVQPSEMSVDWVRPFVPNGSLRQAMAGFLSRRTKEVGYNAYFYYPATGGLQALADGLAGRMSGIHLNHSAAEIDLDKQTVRFENGHQVGFERLISTMPLDVLVRLAKGVPQELRDAARKLRCTTLLNLTFCLRRPLPHSYHWVYFPEPEFPFFRLVFPSNICPAMAPANSSIISAEISNPDMSARQGLQDRVTENLRALGFIHGPEDVAFVEANFLDHAYPIHDLGRQVRVSSIQSFLNSKNVWSIGRFGGWRYSSIDDAIQEALNLVDEIREIPSATAVSEPR